MLKHSFGATIVMPDQAAQGLNMDDAVRAGGVLLLGPLPAPPLIGGVEVGVQMLLRSKLAQEHGLELFNTWGKRDPSVGRATRLWRHARRYLSYLSKLARKRPAIVHVKTSSGANFYQNAIYALVARALGFRVLLQIHSGFFPEFYTSAPAPMRAFIRATLRMPHRLIVLSESWGEYFAGIVGPSTPIFVLPNGVLSDEFAQARPDRARFGIPADRKAILFMGTRDKQTEKAKGLLTLVDAVAKLRAAHPELLLVVAGAGSHKEEMRSVLGEEGQAWLAVGMVGADTKAALYRSCDTFVLPSQYENMPNTVLEAMAAGLPVVATPVGAIPEMVDEARSGFLVPVDDAESIRDRLDRLLSDADLRAAMGRSGREIIDTRYDFSVLERRLSSCYDELGRR